ncbi:hypothetical protein ACHAWO_004313 [Cyclotella atomus]|uniref:Uncharacterized protein n=1 Tax=Cyclotella atomus TaxID=382360 RepID=A0ABD3P9T8_9STRA
MGCSAAFCINQKMQSTQYIHDNFEKAIHQITTTDLPKELGYSTNLGYNAPVKNAYCMYVAITMLEMATACKMAFLPSVTSERIRSLIERQRLAWSDEGDDDDTDDAMLQYGD